MKMVWLVVLGILAATPCVEGGETRTASKGGTTVSVTLPDGWVFVSGVGGWLGFTPRAFAADGGFESGLHLVTDDVSAREAALRNRQTQIYHGYNVGDVVERRVGGVPAFAFNYVSTDKHGRRKEISTYSIKHAGEIVSLWFVVPKEQWSNYTGDFQYIASNIEFH